MSRVLITGANRGIGLALARQLTERGDEVIGTCRRPADELEVTGARVIENVDVSEADGVARLTRELGDEPLDWLINNAGILGRDSLDDPDDESVLRQFQVNALGPLRVTRVRGPEETRPPRLRRRFEGFAELLALDSEVWARTELVFKPYWLADCRVGDAERPRALSPEAPTEAGRWWFVVDAARGAG